MTRWGSNSLPLAGILVGGRSTRLGHAKTLLVTRDGRSMLERTVDLASQVAVKVVLVGRGAPLPAACTGLPTLDDYPGGHGPLAGLCALLAHAAPRGVLLLACDLPLLTTQTLARLVDARGPSTDAVLFGREGLPPFHPCCAWYGPQALAPALKALTNPRPSLASLVCSLQHVCILSPTVEQQAALTNVNTPADARAAGLEQPDSNPGRSKFLHPQEDRPSGSGRGAT